jgi:hypothetical protein
MNDTEITLARIQAASPEELERLNKILYRRIAVRIGSFILLKISIAVAIHLLSKKANAWADSLDD